MTVQRRALGLFSGMALFLSFLYLYPVPTQAPVAITTAETATHESPKIEEKEISFSVLDQGDMAPGAKNRKNYAIYNQEELDSFWNLSHESDTSKAPKIDFNKKYVLVVFAGTKPSTGYKIKVTKVLDMDTKRNVNIAMIVPGEGCKPKEEKTSPYQFVAVPYNTAIELSHKDVIEKVDCKN